MSQIPPPSEPDPTGGKCAWNTCAYCLQPRWCHTSKDGTFFCNGCVDDLAKLLEQEMD